MDSIQQPVSIEDFQKKAQETIMNSLDNMNAMFQANQEEVKKRREAVFGSKSGPITSEIMDLVRLLVQNPAIVPGIAAMARSLATINKENNDLIAKDPSLAMKVNAYLKGLANGG